ncbi:M15 family metallopeptidase, partial [Nocardioides ginsengisoli]|uniref:M15 family metallopeptidase n=1 Tax=Nocardioides ginsengisoli TaxID=363868 RepID=UPI00349E4D55
VLAAGCAATGGAPEPAPTRAPGTTAPTSPASGGEAADAGFSVRSRHLSGAEQAAMRGVTWHPGCPVPLRDLRVVRLTYRDFAGRRRTGRLVVHHDAVAAVGRIFRRLYEIDFPIRRMQPIEAYGGDDYASIEADNTSAFNCRPKTGSTTTWSQHAYGRAIDLDPLENPYVYGAGAGRTSHPGSRPYLDRTRARPGVILDGSPAVAAFEDAGWHWGGRWHGPIDYQHFSAVQE